MAETRTEEDRGRERFESHLGFEIRHERLGSGAWLVAIAGELDLASADRVRDAITALVGDGASDVVVDLAECSFIDSSGLRALLEASRSIADHAGTARLLIAAPDEQPRRLFELTALETVLPIFATRAEAAAAAARSNGADRASS